MKLAYFLFAIAGLALSTEVCAQGPGEVVIRPSAPTAGMVRVQANMQLFFPGPTDDSEEAAKQRDRARRTIYEMAGKECDLLHETIAKECRLESVTSSLNRQLGQSSTQGYNVTGSMTLQITLK